MEIQDILRLAREAGFYIDDIESSEAEFERFAVLLMAAEREACVKVLEELHVWPIQQEMQIATIEDCIAAIRAR